MQRKAPNAVRDSCKPSRAMTEIRFCFARRSELIRLLDTFGNTSRCSPHR